MAAFAGAGEQGHEQAPPISLLEFRDIVAGTLERKGDSSAAGVELPNPHPQPQGRKLGAMGMGFISKFKQRATEFVGNGAAAAGTSSNGGGAKSPKRKSRDVGPYLREKDKDKRASAEYRIPELRFSMSFGAGASGIAAAGRTTTPVQAQPAPAATPLIPRPPQALSFSPAERDPTGSRPRKPLPPLSRPNPHARPFLLHRRPSTADGLLFSNGGSGGNGRRPPTRMPVPLSKPGFASGQTGSTVSAPASTSPRMQEQQKMDALARSQSNDAASLPTSAVPKRRISLRWVGKGRDVDESEKSRTAKTHSDADETTTRASGRARTPYPPVYPSHSQRPSTAPASTVMFAGRAIVDEDEAAEVGTVAGIPLPLPDDDQHQLDPPHPHPHNDSSEPHSHSSDSPTRGRCVCRCRWPDKGEDDHTHSHSPTNIRLGHFADDDASSFSSPSFAGTFSGTIAFSRSRAGARNMRLPNPHPAPAKTLASPPSPSSRPSSSSSSAYARPKSRPRVPFIDTHLAFPADIGVYGSQAQLEAEMVALEEALVTRMDSPTLAPGTPTTPTQTPTTTASIPAKGMQMQMARIRTPSSASASSGSAYSLSSAGSSRAPSTSVPTTPGSVVKSDSSMSSRSSSRSRSSTSIPVSTAPTPTPSSPRIAQIHAQGGYVRHRRTTLPSALRIGKDGVVPPAKPVPVGPIPPTPMEREWARAEAEQENEKALLVEVEAGEKEKKVEGQKALGLGRPPLPLPPVASLLPALAVDVPEPMPEQMGLTSTLDAGFLRPRPGPLGRARSGSSMDCESVVSVSMSLLDAFPVPPALTVAEVGDGPRLARGDGDEGASSLLDVTVGATVGSEGILKGSIGSEDEFHSACSGYVA